jgi:hypothetical protein
MIYNFSRTASLLALVAIVFVSCSKKNDPVTTPQAHDPEKAELASIDRFSATAGHLQVRNSTNGLPMANAAIDFDKVPFITKGIGPAGQTVLYYNFDIQPVTPAPIYVFFKTGQTDPVAGQLNVINVIPGDANYSDFWQVNKVTVPDNYVANSIGSAQEVTVSGYPIEKTNSLVNCPVVPKGSTAVKRFTAESNSLNRCWYKDKLVYYFNFGEKALNTSSTGVVPRSLIYVSFNINPGMANGGPDSGFKTEAGSDQTHNVVATLPADAGYSPLWNVAVYDNSNFNMVNNLTTAMSTTILAPTAGNVNCPVVNVQ